MTKEKQNTPGVATAIAIVTCWLIMALYMWFIYPGPGEWQWLAYIPISVICATIVISVAGIILSHKNDFLTPTICHYDGKDYASCMFCPNATIDPNPIYGGAMPICKCKMMSRQVFNPRNVPRWCPYGRR